MTIFSFQPLFFKITMADYEVFKFWNLSNQATIQTVITSFFCNIVKNIY